MTEFDPRSTTLNGRHVRLEPLGLAHVQDLFEAGNSEDIWTHLPIPMPKHAGEMEAFVREALEMEATGTSVPFAIVDAVGGKAVGSTRYLDIQRPHRGLEIGWTWLGRGHQRSPINTECKLLLLQHAFEFHGAIRVQLKTDLLNVRSQTAIERIGGKKEGVLRNHMIVQPLPRLGLFQHIGFGVAGSEGKPAAAAGPQSLAHSPAPCSQTKPLAKF